MNPKKFFPHNFLSYLFWNSDVTPLQSALQQARIRKHFLYINLSASLSPISYPESSGFLVSGATPGRLWGHRKNSIFLIGCSVTVSIVLPQKSCGNKIRCPQSLPGVAPLTKKPEDFGYEIEEDSVFFSLEEVWLQSTSSKNKGNVHQKTVSFSIYLSRWKTDFEFLF